MKFIAMIILLSAIASCGGKNRDINNPDKAVASEGAIAQANVECVARDGELVGKRGGGVICKLPNGKIVDQMSFL